MGGGKEDLLPQDSGPAGVGDWAALYRRHRLPVFGGVQTGGSYFFLSFSAVCPGGLGSPEKGWTQALSRATGHYSPPHHQGISSKLLFLTYILIVKT